MAIQLRRPFQGTVSITQGFGPTDNPREPEILGYSHFHTGVDYALDTGTPVLAAFDGVIIKAGWDPTGYGNTICLQSKGGLVSLTAHLSNINVVEGQRVTIGQVIGRSGSTGNSTGPHLHWSLMWSNWYIPPAAFLFD